MSTESAKGVVWDLSDLYDSIKDPKIEKDLKQAKEKAKTFEKKYKPLFAQIEKGEKASLAPLLKDYVEIITLSTPSIIYAHLQFAAYTDSSSVGAFLQKMQLAQTDIRHHLRFWELEWSGLDEKIVEPMVQDPAVKPWKHYLENSRKYAPYLLSEEEEKVIDIKDNTGSRAFARLFDEVMNSIPFYLHENGDRIQKTEEEILALLYSEDREKRKAGHQALTEGLISHQRILTFIFNMISQDYKATNDLRQFEHPMEPRNLANEISLPMVQGLVESVKNNYSLVQRYYSLKKKLLGLDVLYDYDRYAPVLNDNVEISWNECQKMVSEAYHDFDEECGKIVDLFFQKNWIDAAVRSGKRGGAFCCETTPELHPYVLVNYTGRLRDVMTVAHELGHGLHQYLAREVGILESGAPLPLAETASVFGEILIFDKLLKQQTDPKKRLGLLCGKIEDMFATVFRQIVMTEFEDKLHDAAKKEGELSTDQISRLWIEANQPMHGEVVELTEEYRYWWMYIPHFIHSPFYCYAYSFAQLLVLSLYKNYKDGAVDFVPHFKKMLALGSSKRPEEICSMMQIDIQSPQFWQSGFSVLEEMLEQAESIAETASI